MIGPETPHDGPQTSSDEWLGSPLDPNFCVLVFGRQLSPQELDRKNFNIRVDDLDRSIEALSGFPEWQVLDTREVPFGMKVVTAQRLNDDPKELLYLFMYQDLVEY